MFDFLVEEPVRPKVLLPIVEENGTRRQVMQAVEEEAVNIVESVSDESSDSETDNEQGGRNAAAAIAKSPRRDVREVSSEDEEHEKHIEHDEDKHERADDDDEDDAVIISPPAELEYMHKVNRPQLHISINGNDIVDHEPEGYYRSMSDSGISMGSSGSFQHPLPIVHEEPDSRPSSRNKYQNELALIDPRWHWPALSPQPPHDGYIPPPCPQPPPAAIMYEVPVYNPYPYPYPPTPYSTPPPPMPEPYVREPLEIREPKGQRNKPSYFRSFGRMNSRLLLRMEDDLADLEEELRQVEEEIDTAEHDSDHSTSSSGSVIRELKLREAEIYTEFHAKLDDYYHALEMKQKVDEISSPAKLSDLPKHRQWLESRILQPDRIRRLINNDLRKFSPKRQAIEIDQTQKTTTIQEPVFHPQYLAYTAFINGVLPLIMFKFCTGVLNRLILLLTIIVIGSTVQDRVSVSVGRNELTCTLVCICISAFAAVFL